MVTLCLDIVRQENKKKPVKIWVLLGVIFLIGVVVAFVLLNKEKPPTPPTGNTNQGINFGPPTEEDKVAVEQNKQEITEGQNNPPPAPTPAPDGRTKRTPVITYAQQYETNIETTGYIPGVFEEGGTCKATFSKGGLKVVKESAGFADVNRTSCTPISVPVSEFSEKGKWTVVLGYESTSSTGVSASLEIEVQ